MQACSYAGIVLAGSFAVLTQMAACASQTTTTTEPAGTSDVADTSAETDMAPPPTADGAPADTAPPAESTAAAASDEGSDRDLAQIQGIVGSDQNRKPVRACYEKAQKELPDLKGTMTITFVLDPKGNVKSAELNAERSEIKSPDVANCAINVIKGLKFPPSPKGMETTVNYPYNFKPPQGSGSGAAPVAPAK